MANRFDLDLTILPTDEFGQVIETNGTNVSYVARFSLDANSSLQQGSGGFSVPKTSQLDVNADGVNDMIWGDFTYFVSASNSVTINLQNLEVQYGAEEEWETFRGGGFSMTLAVEQAEDTLHRGGYSIFYDDGTNEVGQWTSDTLRLEPLTKISD